MNKNILIKGLISFLLPLIIIYSAFLITRHFQEDSQGILYSFLLLTISAIIYLALENKIARLKSILSLKITIWFFSCLCFFYTILVFTTIAVNI